MTETLKTAYNNELVNREERRREENMENEECHGKETENGKRVKKKKRDSICAIFLT